MGEVRIVYSDLENVISNSKRLREELESYSNTIKSDINNVTNNLPGSDSKGYVSNATSLASAKSKELLNKRSKYKNLESSLKDIIQFAKDKDKAVSKEFNKITSKYNKKRKWYQKAGDWAYNTFCVDIPNHFSGTRWVMDGIKWSGNNVGKHLKKVRNYFKYGDGKYIWNIGKAFTSVIVAAGACVIAVLSIPVGGEGIPVAIATIGVAASTVSLSITMLNADKAIKSNERAMDLKKDHPGAARYYGSTKTLNEYYKKNDMGGAKENAICEGVGKTADGVKVAADTTKFVTDVASLGFVRDYRITTTNNNVKGYEFSKENVLKNVKHDMGISSTGKIKAKNFVPSVKGSTSAMTKKNDLEVSKTFVKTYCVAKTTNNTMDLAEGVNSFDETRKAISSGNIEKWKLNDYYSHGKDMSGGFLGNTKFTSPIDKYGTKTAKTIESGYKWVTDK